MNVNNAELSGSKMCERDFFACKLKFHVQCYALTDKLATAVNGLSNLLILCDICITFADTVSLVSVA